MVSVKFILALVAAAALASAASATCQVGPCFEEHAPCCPSKDHCCEGLKCVESQGRRLLTFTGTCQPECVKEDEDCTVGSDECCEGFTCVEKCTYAYPQRRLLTGSTPPPKEGVCKPTFTACPNKPTVEYKGETVNKVCVDAPDRPGQATCGLPTCQEVCEASCGSTGYNFEPKDCANFGGGNCQGVSSATTGAPFNGGPCCGCKPDACKRAAEALSR